MPLAETIKELVSLILEGVDLLDHTSIFLLRTINHRVIPIIRILSWFVPTGTSSEFFPPEYPSHWDIPTRSLDIPLGYGLPRTRFKFKVLECELLWTINGRRIYPFNKGLRIYGGGVPSPFWHIKNWYFYWWYKVETLQVVRLAFLV